VLVTQPIKVDGLATLTKQLKAISKEAPKAMRLANNEAANIVVNAARPTVPVRSGRTRTTLKARSTRSEARAVGGGTRAVHYPWLEFGGRVGRRKATRRPRVKEGRYLYPGWVQRRQAVYAELEKHLFDLCRQYGLDVS
jgi:Bacteriophage HK97-gp10, putative tail-component